MSNRAAIKIFWQRATQTLRLMVGVGNYRAYVRHMQQHHAALPVMSEREYFRYCQSSRYGGAEGSMKRCPC